MGNNDQDILESQKPETHLDPIAETENLMFEPEEGAKLIKPMDEYLHPQEGFNPSRGGKESE